ncbi:Triose-phosphate transporter domain [Macleaya cordata]|uniref:Probable purine permease n=1 Tax=Macleaya cordata TaxID=56857 RepID=A0A200QXR9_MACCD|nr:Triose-phosphate transporter domain [Macleaya cordata]
MEGVLSYNNQEHHHQEQQQQPKIKKNKNIKLGLLLLNCLLLSVGQVGGPLLLRLYYLHGGQRKWLTSWLQTAAFPILLIPLFASWSNKSRSQSSTNSNPSSTKQKFLLNPKLFIASAILGTLIGLDSFLFALGLSYLPVSTSALLMATQLAFTSVFALLLVKQKFTPYSINSVVLLTLGSIILGLHTSGDRPVGVSNGQYFLGFFMTLGAAALLGFILPSVEFAYAKACKVITYDLVIQMQFLVSMFATLLCTIAMIINKDFQAISREAKEYGLGEAKYYMVLIGAAILMQSMLVGNLGVIFCSTSLFSGVLLALLLPVQQIFAIIFFNEKFNAEKGMSLALSFWGFASYFYGEYKQTKKNNKLIISMTTHQHQEFPNVV